MQHAQGLQDEHSSAFEELDPLPLSMTMTMTMTFPGYRVNRDSIIRSSQPWSPMDTSECHQTSVGSASPRVASPHQMGVVSYTASAISTDETKKHLHSYFFESARNHPPGDDSRELLSIPGVVEQDSENRSTNLKRCRLCGSRVAAESNGLHLSSKLSPIANRTGLWCRRHS